MPFFPLPALPPLRQPLPHNEVALDAARTEARRRWGLELGDAWRVLVSTGDRTVVYSTPDVVGVPLRDESWVPIGPLLDRRPRDLPEPALDELTGRRPLVYVALGTTFNFRADVFEDVLEALAGEAVDVLVSMGGRDPSELGTVAGNAIVVPYVASRAVLRRAAVHVTHAGAGSVHESLAAGVPMVCVPLGSDNAMWAHRLEMLGVAEISEPAAAGVAVRRLLGDPGFAARAAELGEHLRAFDGERAVADAFGALLG